ncbi:MAG: 16S rRNA (cytidine(1402)-2'-O)-methyltransferase [Opitutales bacterium]|nr:16S rRNA (cytidine(1402)-2'-O)-methyltransferase [Opitutales bacterium]
MSEYGTLYVVATPIGNLADISERALRTLRACDVVVCEDTRVTGLLLSKFGISKEMFVSEDSRERAVAPKILEMLKGGKNVALVSDAGTPCISDPGFRVVRACRAEGVAVSPVAGACAFAAALSASGLPSDSFLFAGFLPAKTSARKNFFEKYRDFPHTLIFYESPYRIEKFMDDALEVFGAERAVCVAKEISKIHERFFVGKLADVRAELEKSSTKGEFVALIAPEGYAL